MSAYVAKARQIQRERGLSYAEACAELGRRGAKAAARARRKASRANAEREKLAKLRAAGAIWWE